ncbi:hypothetical protein EGI16_01895 [Chryseobacterium sp. G0240]|nr:hypothetical protein EGI16_01895 [Chryseobacterium sp. G0240]
MGFMLLIINTVKAKTSLTKINSVNSNEYFYKFKIKVMIQLLISLAIVMAFNAFYYPAANKSENRCIQADPPPKIGGQW